MIIKPLISLVLLGILAFAILHRNVNLLMRSGMAIMVAFGTWITWSPDSATAIAQIIGVGRGADLIFYMWILISMLVILMIYLKFISVNRIITEFARQIAIDRARFPQNGKRGEDN